MSVRPLVRTAALAGLAAAVLLGTATSAPAASTSHASIGAAHYAKARGFAHSGSPRTSANMTYHGGKVLTQSIVQPIYWGTSWAGYVGDKEVGIESFYRGFSGSNYAKTSTEYTGSNGRVGTGVTYNAAVVDTSPASGGNNTSAILAEVLKVIKPDPSGYGYYPVYTDVPRGSAGYCAWHSSGTANGVQLQIAFFFKLDGDAGCDPQDSSGLHSQGLAALANVSAHELSEAMTDPTQDSSGSPAWYDSKGAENGDKCAWTFNAPLITFSNGSQWKVQGEWSNAAYTAGTGYPNSSGQHGCLDGH